MSIFSINDNSNYNSILSQAKANKEYYTNIDMAETIKQYYNQFNQIVNYAFNDTNKTSFTEADINSMPKGYAINGIKSMDFNDPSNNEYHSPKRFFKFFYYKYLSNL
ncbi:hypothetical protein RC13_00445 [Campylobacter jejuni]|uniref:hypothetical protein n=1 Tax=Campylobacter jejuni TaxID=197 RepID=UPI00073DE50F|nr:hypothetical protein [Campylobacter jejuni]ALW04069.1 hypothetical protein RC13_00445 [Campylobacter jejuni]